MMDQELTIRVAGLNDMGTIETLARKIWPVAYGEILSQDQLNYMLQLFYSPEALQEQITTKEHQFLIAELNKTAVGFASFSISNLPGIWQLHKLYVDTTIQGRGIGKALLQTILAALNNDANSALRLNVNRNNKARQFYERLGFKVIHEVDIEIGNGYFMNDYVMEIELRKPNTTDGGEFS